MPKKQLVAEVLIDLHRRLVSMGCVLPAHQGVTTLRQRARVTARQLEVRMLVIDEIHSILAGTFRERLNPRANITISG